jgi:DNA-binding Lrp family transcriptional regulator
LEKVYLLDPVDKTILWELHYNCRISYQALAEKLGISANAVKKRVTKLIDTGLIDQFIVVLAPTIMEAEILLIQIYTDGSEHPEDFIQLVGKHPMTFSVGPVVSESGGIYNIWAQYIGSEGLAELARYLRQLPKVTKVDLHPLISPADTRTMSMPDSSLIGKEPLFSNMEKRILRNLVNDPRMSISDIANHTGLTARRVRKIVQQFLEDGRLMFSVRWNLTAGGYDDFYLRIHIDEKKTSPQELMQWLEKEFPRDYWNAYVSAYHPVLYARYIIRDLKEAEQIFRRIKQSSFVKSVNALIHYSETKFPWPGETHLKDLLAETES